MCSSGNSFVSEAGGQRNKSRSGQIGLSVACGSSPLQYFFEGSCVARAQWQGDWPRQLAARFGVIQRVLYNERFHFVIDLLCGKISRSIGVLSILRHVLRLKALQDLCYSTLKFTLISYQRWSRGRKARGQGQEHKKKNPRPRSRPRTAFPRTDPLEAKDRNAWRPRTEVQMFSKQKRSSRKIFRRSQKFFSGEIQNFNNSKNSAVLEPRTRQFSSTWGFEAKAKDLTFEAKDLKSVLEDSTSVFYMELLFGEASFKINLKRSTTLQKRRRVKISVGAQEHVGATTLASCYLLWLLSDQSLYHIGMRLLTMLEAGRRVWRLFAWVRFVLPNKCFIRMFWLMVEQSWPGEWRWVRWCDLCVFCWSISLPFYRYTLINKLHIVSQSKSVYLRTSTRKQRKSTFGIYSCI